VEIPKTVLELVDRFNDHRDRYRSPEYNETQVRREFIDPLFESLGWDVQNKKNYAEPWKEVIHEDAIRIGGFMKAPDYSFRLGGKRLFFLEAKKPALNLKDDPLPAYQLRRYAWTAKLPVSILSDFDEFIVYDTRVKPVQGDKASTARVIYFPYTEYPDRWEEIVSVFSPQAIQKGALEKYVESKKKKRGTAEVDDEFLAEIEVWRDLLARNIALRNSGIKQRDLNFAVQRTIDRIIFLRICEDRGIEPYGRLMALENGADVYARLRVLYERADERYNSGLFHFHKERNRPGPPDTFTPSLAIDDKVLKAIFKRLYYPESPYEFSVFPAEILGHVYERFLGSVIHLSSGGRAKVEQKPEVRKAGGVYYTPTYIVEYIVKHTVGKLIEGKTPQEIAGCTETWRPAKGGRALAVLDPACGSGSFLLGAYQYLLNWHLDTYSKDPHKWSRGKDPRIYQHHTGVWRLTTAERKRILLANIYGVDIDSQAVEVTKLSLLLKVLEGETEDSLERQLHLLHERALPDLANNIKCGNSLIGSDFYKGQQVDAFDEEEQYRINAFDWNDEFSDVMKSGGFDAVIGNPPYVRQESIRELKEYFRKKFVSYSSTADLYVYFIERAIHLLNPTGRFAFIVSSGFLRTTFGEPLRSFLSESVGLQRIVDFGGLPIFESAKDTYVCIPIITKSRDNCEIEVTQVSSLVPDKLQVQLNSVNYAIPLSRLSTDGWSFKSDVEADLFEKICAIGIPLGRHVHRRMYYGLKTGMNAAFVIDTKQRCKLCLDDPRYQPLIHPVLGGEDIRRYIARERGMWIIVIPAGWTNSEISRESPKLASLSERQAWDWLTREYPDLAGYLKSFEEPCRRRQDKGDYWWELRSCDYYKEMNAPKIIFPDICKAPRFYLDATGSYILNTAYLLASEDVYLLGILNSRLFWFCIGNISIPFGTRAGQYRYRLIYQYMEKVPIRAIDPSDSRDRIRHDKMVSLVQRMLDLHKRVRDAQTGHEYTLLERQIASTDLEIDHLVYELYGLTAEEIAIVEETSRG
jgi:predicted type IV restriction endonuclease